MITWGSPKGLAIARACVRKKGRKLHSGIVKERNLKTKRTLGSKKTKRHQPKLWLESNSNLMLK